MENICDYIHRNGSPCTKKVPADEAARCKAHANKTTHQLCDRNCGKYTAADDGICSRCQIAVDREGRGAKAPAAPVAAPVHLVAPVVPPVAPAAPAPVAPPITLEDVQKAIREGRDVKVVNPASS